MKKAILTFFLTAALILCGCANVSLPEPEQSAVSKSVSEKIEEIVSTLPPADEFRGETLTVLTSETSLFKYDETVAGTIKNAVNQRGEVLQNAYGMALEAKSCKESAAVETLQNAVKAGVPAADFLCFTAETTVQLQLAGLLADLTDLPYFDAETVLADNKNAAELYYGNSLYLLPDPSTLPYEQTYVLFYNRELVEQTGLEAPEALVNRGAWTLDVCKQYCEAVAASVMSKSSVDYKTDIFGLGCTENTSLLPDLLRQGAGLSCFTVENGLPVFNFENPDILTSKAESLKALYDSRSHYPTDGIDPRQTFEAGRLGFYIEKLPYLYNLSADCGFDYGVLPLPKNNDGGEYYSPTTKSVRVYSVPQFVENDQRTGLGLMAMCLSGGKQFRDAELTTLLTLYSVDNDQSCMLQAIVDSVGTDFGVMYGSGIKQIYNLSTGLFTETIGKGGRFKNEINEKLPAFTKFVGENFEETLDEQPNL